GGDVRAPPAARRRARGGVHRVARAPHPAGRSRPRAACRRGRRAHPRARGRDHGEVADRRRRVTPRLALLGCGWVAAEPGISRAPSDWRALVSSADVDAVLVCTPNGLHAEQALAALAAGKHVLCEKPMATSSADGEAMLAAAAQADRLLLVLHPWR